LKRVEGKAFAVRAKRGDKNFPVGSVELSGEFGKRILDSVDAKVDLKNPEITVFVEIMQGKALVFFEKVRGLKGLPVVDTQSFFWKAKFFDGKRAFRPAQMVVESGRGRYLPRPLRVLQ
jgi:adenylyl- and sulfurtransferase ThiI